MVVCVEQEARQKLLVRARAAVDGPRQFIARAACITELQGPSKTGQPFSRSRDDQVGASAVVSLPRPRRSDHHTNEEIEGAPLADATTAPRGA